MTEAGLDETRRFGPVLVGMRGTGKSALAPRVALRLQMEAVDADEELQRQQGCTIPQLFARHGERGFRSLEQTLLLDDLLRRPAVVLATGGGAVLHEGVRAVLRQRVTVWLTAPVETLARRITGSGRPSLTGRPIEQELSDVLAGRAPLYEQVASLVLDTSETPAEALVAAICEHWAQTGRVRQSGER